MTALDSRNPASGMPPCTRDEVPGQDGRVQRVIAFVMGASGDATRTCQEIIWAHDANGRLVVYTRHKRMGITRENLIREAWNSPMTSQYGCEVKFIWVGDLVAAQLDRCS